MEHGLSCSTVGGIFPDQGSNPCPLIGRRILNHCATREIPVFVFLNISDPQLVEPVDAQPAYTADQLYILQIRSVFLNDLKAIPLKCNHQEV